MWQQLWWKIKSLRALNYLLYSSKFDDLTVIFYYFLFVWRANCYGRIAGQIIKIKARVFFTLIYFDYVAIAMVKYRSQNSKIIHISDLF
jgi:hypothetical protein